MSPHEFPPSESRREFFRELRGRHRHGRARASARHRRPRSRARSTPGAKSRRTSSRRPRTSSSCSWKARRARWISSIPSPSCKRWHGKPLPRIATKDLKLAFIKPTATVLGSSFEFREARSMRNGAFGVPAASRHVRRRHLPGPLDAHARRSTITPVNYSCSPATWWRPPHDGRVGDLWTRQRIAEPARIRRALLRRRHQRRFGQLHQRLSAVHVRGDAVPQPGRSDSLSVESEGRIERDAAYARST